MRRVVVYELLALNGVAEDPDWFFAGWDEETDVRLLVDYRVVDPSRTESPATGP